MTELGVIGESSSAVIHLDRKQNLAANTMALKRSHDANEVDGGLKKRKMGATSDPKSNPYLAHMYPSSGSEDEGGVPLAPSTKADRVQSSYGSYGSYQRNGLHSNTTLANFKRHKTTSAMAKVAEDGPINAFTGEQLSNSYFNILKSRRNLPVHSQR